MNARTDTCHAIPVARPTVPAPHGMIPGLTLTGVAHYTVKRPWFVRHSPRKGSGFVVGTCLAAVVTSSYAIAQILTGGAL